MGFGQALVTQSFSAEPSLLTAKRALYHKAYFADGQLPWAERLVLDGLIQDAPCFQSLLVLLAAIGLVGVESGSRFNTCLVNEVDQCLAAMPVDRRGFDGNHQVIRVDDSVLFIAKNSRAKFLHGLCKTSLYLPC